MFAWIWFRRNVLRTSPGKRGKELSLWGTNSMDLDPACILLRTFEENSRWKKVNFAVKFTEFVDTAGNWIYRNCRECDFSGEIDLTFSCSYSCKHEGFPGIFVTRIVAFRSSSIILWKNFECTFLNFHISSSQNLYWNQRNMYAILSPVTLQD